MDTDYEDALPMPLFLSPTGLLVEYERRQCRDEGKDTRPLEAEFDDLAAREEVPREAFGALLDDARELPQREEYGYEEPNALADIRAARPPSREFDRTLADLPDPYDTVYGGWLGACAGCLLGKPVQGWSREKIEGFLRDSGAFPLEGYFRSDVPEAVRERYDIYDTVETDSAEESLFVNDLSHMPVDDDIDYILVGLGVASESGPGFDATDVANYWLQQLPAFNTYTAERVAYRNLLNLVAPPESARHRNPFREHVGALIRADFWGYAAVGDPERAAEYAWRDARVSHVKNGIYGEMWAGAMLAAAPLVEDPRELPAIGLGQIPENCRLAEAVEAVVSWSDAGVEYCEAVDRVHERWDDGDQFDWVHTISNAQILTIGLLWGDGEFGSSLCRAVQAGFDTDSHGATLGSLLGLHYGADALPEKWIGPLSDRVDTSLVEYGHQRISDLAEETLSVVEGFS